MMIESALGLINALKKQANIIFFCQVFSGRFLAVLITGLLSISTGAGLSEPDSSDIKERSRENEEKIKDNLPALNGVSDNEPDESMFFFSDFSRQAMNMAEGYLSMARLQSMGQRIGASDAQSHKNRVTSQDVLQQEIQGVKGQFNQTAVNSFIASVKGIKHPVFRNLSISSDIFTKEGKRNSYVRTVVPLFYDKPQRNVFFAEPGLTYYNKRLTYNMGLGYRYVNEADDFMLGGNIFYDYDTRGKNRRWSQGLEVGTPFVTLSGNLYQGMNGWHASPTNDELEEKPASGYDVKLKTILPFYPKVNLSTGYFCWKGPGVDLFGDGKRVDSPSGYVYELGYNPCSLMGVSLKRTQELGSHHKDTSLSLQLNYDFSKTLAEQLSFNYTPDTSLASRIFSDVDRFYGIVLNTRYRLPTISLPASYSVKEGEQLRFEPLVNERGYSLRYVWITPGLTLDSTTVRTPVMTAPLFQAEKPNIYPVTVNAFYGGGSKVSALSRVVVSRNPAFLPMVEATSDVKAYEQEKGISPPTFDIISFRVGGKQDKTITRCELTGSAMAHVVAVGEQNTDGNSKVTIDPCEEGKLYEVSYIYRNGFPHDPSANMSFFDGAGVLSRGPPFLDSEQLVIEAVDDHGEKGKHIVDVDVIATIPPKVCIQVDGQSITNKESISLGAGKVNLVPKIKVPDKHRVYSVEWQFTPDVIYTKKAHGAIEAELTEVNRDYAVKVSVKDQFNLVESNEITLKTKPALSLSVTPEKMDIPALVEKQERIAAKASGGNENYRYSWDKNSILSFKYVDATKNTVSLAYNGERPADGTSVDTSVKVHVDDLDEQLASASATIPIRIWAAPLPEIRKITGDRREIVANNNVYYVKKDEFCSIEVSGKGYDSASIQFSLVDEAGVSKRCLYSQCSFDAPASGQVTYHVVAKDAFGQKSSHDASSVKHLTFKVENITTEISLEPKDIGLPVYSAQTYESVINAIVHGAASSNLDIKCSAKPENIVDFTVVKPDTIHARASHSLSLCKGESRGVSVSCTGTDKTTGMSHTSDSHKLTVWAAPKIENVTLYDAHTGVQVAPTDVEPGNIVNADFMVKGYQLQQINYEAGIQGVPDTKMTCRLEDNKVRCNGIRLPYPMDKQYNLLLKAQDMLGQTTEYFLPLKTTRVSIEIDGVKDMPVTATLANPYGKLSTNISGLLIDNAQEVRRPFYEWLSIDSEGNKVDFFGFVSTKARRTEIFINKKPDVDNDGLSVEHYVRFELSGHDVYSHEVSELQKHTFPRQIEMMGKYQSAPYAIKVWNRPKQPTVDITSEQGNKPGGDGTSESPYYLQQNTNYSLRMASVGRLPLSCQYKTRENNSWINHTDETITLSWPSPDQGVFSVRTVDGFRQNSDSQSLNYKVVAPLSVAVSTKDKGEKNNIAGQNSQCSEIGCIIRTSISAAIQGGVSPAEDKVLWSGDHISFMSADKTSTDVLYAGEHTVDAGKSIELSVSWKVYDPYLNSYLEGVADKAVVVWGIPLIDTSGITCDGKYSLEENVRAGTTINIHFKGGGYQKPVYSLKLNSSPDNNHRSQFQGHCKWLPSPDANGNNISCSVPIPENAKGKYKVMITAIDRLNQQVKNTDRMPEVTVDNFDFSTTVPADIPANAGNENARTYQVTGQVAGDEGLTLAWLSTDSDASNTDNHVLAFSNVSSAASANSDVSVNSDKAPSSGNSKKVFVKLKANNSRHQIFYSKSKPVTIWGAPLIDISHLSVTVGNMLKCKLSEAVLKPGVPVNFHFKGKGYDQTVYNLSIISADSGDLVESSVTCKCMDENVECETTIPKKQHESYLLKFTATDAFGQQSSASAKIYVNQKQFKNLSVAEDLPSSAIASNGFKAKGQLIGADSPVSLKWLSVDSGEMKSTYTSDGYLTVDSNGNITLSSPDISTKAGTFKSKWLVLHAQDKEKSDYFSVPAQVNVWMPPAMPEFDAIRHGNDAGSNIFGEGTESSPYQLIEQDHYTFFLKPSAGYSKKSPLLYQWSSDGKEWHKVNLTDGKLQFTFALKGAIKTGTLHLRAMDDFYQCSKVKQVYFKKQEFLSAKITFANGSIQDIPSVLRGKAVTKLQGIASNGLSPYTYKWYWDAKGDTKDMNILSYKQAGTLVKYKGNALAAGTALHNTIALEVKDRANHKTKVQQKLSVWGPPAIDKTALKITDAQGSPVQYQDGKWNVQASEPLTLTFKGSGYQVGSIKYELKFNKKVIAECNNTLVSEEEHTGSITCSFNAPEDVGTYKSYTITAVDGFTQTSSKENVFTLQVRQTSVISSPKKSVVKVQSPSLYHYYHADGVTKAPMQVLLRDADDNPVKGATVHLMAESTQEMGSVKLSKNTCITDDDGNCLFSVTSKGLDAHSKVTVTATTDRDKVQFSNTTPVIFVPEIKVGKMTLTKYNNEGATEGGSGKERSFGIKSSFDIKGGIADKRFDYDISDKTLLSIKQGKATLRGRGTVIVSFYQSGLITDKTFPGLKVSIEPLPAPTLTLTDSNGQPLEGSYNGGGVIHLMTGIPAGQDNIDVQLHASVSYAEGSLNPISHPFMSSQNGYIQSAKDCRGFVEGGSYTYTVNARYNGVTSGDTRAVVNIRTD